MEESKVSDHDPGNLTIAQAAELLEQTDETEINLQGHEESGENTTEKEEMLNDHHHDASPKQITVVVGRPRKRLKQRGFDEERVVGKIYFIDSIPRKWDGKRFRTMCFVHGCKKHASGSSCRCIAHGGGARCQVKLCTKSALRGTGKCAQHGGGFRCEEVDCNRVAIGKSKHCIAHGGGTRCIVLGCSKAARGTTKRCKQHGGGKRCMEPNCPRSAEGRTNYCIAHGGGTRCEILKCTRAAQGNTRRCIGHGGGRRCAEANCNKSTQGSTGYCLSHGGGKRCLYSNCDAFARSADFCRNHGGGRICKWPRCDDLSLNKMDYCQNHLAVSRAIIDRGEDPETLRTNFDMQLSGTGGIPHGDHDPTAMELHAKQTTVQDGSNISVNNNQGNGSAVVVDL